MQWDKWIFIDSCLPFGLRSALKLFNIMADLLTWILHEQGVIFVIHYLDDFLTIGSPGSPAYCFNLNTIVRVWNAFGIPLVLEKVVAPATSLEIVLDSLKIEACLPGDKLSRVQQAVAQWLHRRNATKREILSLVGQLQHVAKVVHPGCTFYTRLNNSFKSDIWWWHIFLQYRNGNSFLHMTSQDRWQVSIQTDASGAWHCGAFFNGAWLQ